jgi:hypothetical protein
VDRAYCLRRFDRQRLAPPLAVPVPSFLWGRVSNPGQTRRFEVAYIGFVGSIEEQTGNDNETEHSRLHSPGCPSEAKVRRLALQNG